MIVKFIQLIKIKMKIIADKIDTWWWGENA